MKRILLVSLVVVSLVAGIAVPVFAHGSEDGEATSANHEAWEAMHEACEDGDWEAMVEAAEQVHGEELSYMPCHGDENNRWGGRDGHMGGGMMGGGSGDMMGW